MSVTGPSANTNAIQRLSELELEKGIVGEGSWHNQYKDSCYIFIGGLDTRLTEGDVIIVFSQFGEPIDINLKRDKNTGKSLGYCFLGYRDQRSTILAVDNFNGSTLLGRRIRVDHVLDYSAPLQFEDEVDEEGNKIRKEYEPTGAEGAGIGKYYVTKSEQLIRETTRKKKSEPPPKQMDEDEKWAMEFEESLKKESKEESEISRRSNTDISYERRRREEGSSRRLDRDSSRKHHKESTHRRTRSTSRSRSRSRNRHRNRYRNHRDREYDRRSRSKDTHRDYKHRRRHRDRH